MLQEKASYKAAFSQLRGLKGEIEHLQLLLEQSRKKLQQDFKQWLGMVARQQAQQQAQLPDAGGAAASSSNSSRPSTAGGLSGRSGGSSSSSTIAAAHQITGLDPVQQQQQPTRPPSGRLRKAVSAVTAASVLPQQEGSSQVLPRALSSRTTQPLDLSKIDPQLLQAAAPHLTGNPDADADIIGFYEAKQKLLQLKLGGNKLG